MSRTAEILQKALDELGAQAEEPAPSKLEILLAESINLARLTKVAKRISHAEFVELLKEMLYRYEAQHDEFSYYTILDIWDMYGPSDFEDTVPGRERALKAFKQLQLKIADLEAAR